MGPGFDKAQLEGHSWKNQAEITIGDIENLTKRLPIMIAPCINFSLDSQAAAK
jgi:hypothetical protein